MKKILALTFALLTAAALTAAPLTLPSNAWGSSGASLQQGSELELLAQFGFMDPLGMITSGNLAFVGLQKGQASEVVIFDLANPAQLAILAVIPFTTGGDYFYEVPQAYPLAVVGEILYVGVPRLESTGWLNGGIQMFDIRDPSNPIPIGEFSPESYYACPIQMIISGNNAYLLDNQGGINVLDISNPVNPSLVGYFLDVPYNALAVQDGYAYALNTWYPYNALYIYDISNPITPTLLSTYNPEGRGINGPMAVKGNYAYLSESTMWERWIEVIDISNPYQPVRHSDIPQLVGPNYQFIFSDNWLYAVRRDGLAIYDASDPLNPLLLGNYLGFEGTAAQPQGDRTAFLDMTGFQMLDTSDPINPSRLGFHSWPQAVRSIGNITAEGTDLFTIQQDKQQVNDLAFLQVINITAPGEPQVSGSLIIDSGIYGRMIASDSYLYLPTQVGLTIVDARNPANMETASLDLNGSTGLTIAGDVQAETAYALSSYPVGVSRQGYLKIIDVNEPLKPILLGDLPVGEDVSDLSIAKQGASTIAYITTPTGWLAVDVSDPAAPVVLFRDQSTPGIQRIETVSQGENITVYLARAGEGLIAVDVSQPSDPQNLSVYTVDIGPEIFLAAEGTLVYIARPYVQPDESDVKLIDYSQPAQPRLLASAAVPRVSFTEFAVTDDYVIATSNYDTYFFSNRSRLEGKVTDHNILPIEGVTLTLDTGAATLSDPDGLYAFPDLVIGSYAITPTLDGYVFVPPQAAVKDFLSHWQSFVMLAPPVSTTLEPGITTTLTYTDVQGLPTSFIFPSGLVSVTSTATVTPRLANSFFGMDFAGHAFDLSLQEAGGPTKSTVFPVPVSVAIHYSPMDTAVITDTLLLALYRLEGDAWVKSQDTCSIASTPVPVEEGVFHAVICQAGRYALFGPTHAVALPLVAYGSDAPSEFPPP